MNCCVFDVARVRIMLNGGWSFEGIVKYCKGSASSGGEHGLNESAA